MKIFIVTEGTAKTGFGHIGRCSALYQAFQEKGCSPQFIVNGDESAKELLKGYKVFFFDWTKETSKLYEQVKDSGIVIIDSYLAGIEIYKKISELAKKAVYIDDYIRLDYPKGIIVNGTIYGEDLPYPKKDGVEYLLGSKYIILRKEFWEVPEKHIREEISNVLITFGGSDIRNMTPKVLQMLSDSYPSWEKHVVIGSAFSNTNEIKQAADAKTIFHYVPNAQGMKNLMLECDIAISAAGQTTNELVRCGIPSIVLQLADNQRNNILAYKRIIMPSDLLIINNVFETKAIRMALKYIINLNIRINIATKTKLIVDGTGAKNLIKELIK